MFNKAVDLGISSSWKQVSEKLPVKDVARNEVNFRRKLLTQLMWLESNSVRPKHQRIRKRSHVFGFGPLVVA